MERATWRVEPAAVRSTLLEARPMVHKLALSLGALAALGVIAVALGAGNLTTRAAPAEEAASLPQSGAAVAPAVRTQVDTVYVKPAPKQQVVHVTRPAKPS